MGEDDFSSDIDTSSDTDFSSDIDTSSDMDFSSDIDSSSDTDFSSDVDTDIDEDVGSDLDSDIDTETDDISEDTEENFEDTSDFDSEEDVGSDIEEDVDSDFSEDDFDDTAEEIPDVVEEDVSDDIGNDVSDDGQDDNEVDSESEYSGEIEEDINEDTSEETLSEGIDDLENTDESDLPEDVEETVEESDDIENTDTEESIEELDEVEGTEEEETSEELDEVENTETEETPEELDEVENTETEETPEELEEVENVKKEEKSEELEDVEKSDTEMTQETSESQEIHNLSEYMNAHNYGQGDYSTYSQDPQWRQLMREEYPDVELPELSQENAYHQLSQYMNEHNYGLDDLSTYSQDPIWRELQSTAFPDYKLPPLVDSEALANGRVSDDIFNGTTELQDISMDTKLEDLSKEDFNDLQSENPERASQLLTDYNDRNIPGQDLNDLPKSMAFDNGLNMEIVESETPEEMSILRDSETGKEYTSYPNLMGRVSHMCGQQGNNDIGMNQDCGIASTAKGINDLYGKNVTSENRLVDYAKQTGECDLSDAVLLPDGTVDYSECGGTIERNVRDFYKANGIDATAYTGSSVPTLDSVGETLKNGGVVTMAVNHDLMWNYDEAQAFNPETDIDLERYAQDRVYQSRIDNIWNMHDGIGTYKADHFVNVSNAIYDSSGNLSHFVVSDTGNGTTKMVPVEYLQRAYNGLDDIRVSAQGCVVANRRK